MKVLLDNNAVDKLSDNIEFVKSHPEIKFFICREAVGEVCNNKSYKEVKKEVCTEGKEVSPLDSPNVQAHNTYNPTRNIVSLLKVGVEYLPNAVFVLGYSILDGESTYCDKNTADVYRNMLNPSHNNIPDAIIAATAVKNDCVLITNDIELYKKMKKYSYNVMTFEELLDKLS